MATTTLTAVTVILSATGVEANPSSVVTAGTVTFSVGDLSRTFVRLENISSTASTIVTIGASADPMVAKGISAYTVTIATETTVYIGASWDSARFKTTSGTVVFTFAAAATVNIDMGVLAVY